MKKLVPAILLLCLLVNPLRVNALDTNGHFDDTEWFGLSDSAGYDSLSVDITPEVWAGGEHGYYYANNATFTNGTNIYGGLQTNGHDGTRFIGKMAIFSIWDVTNGIAESGGTGTPFSGEGTGYSVRLPFDWQAGTTYRFTMYIDQDATAGSRLWGASLTDVQSGSTTRIGRIYAPVAFGKIHNPITFHEKYTGDTEKCAHLQPSQVRFSNMTANNGTIRATSWSHYYKKSIPGCDNSIRLEDVSEGYRSSIGRITENSVEQAPDSAEPTLQTNYATSETMGKVARILSFTLAGVMLVGYLRRKSIHK